MQARNAASVLPEPVGAQIRVFFLARMCGQPSSCGSVGVPNLATNHSRTSGCAHSRDLHSGASGVAAWFIFRSRNAYSAQKTFSESIKNSTEWHFWRIGWRKAGFRYWRFAGGRVFFAATAFFGLYPGSPVAAFSTSPPPSRAISARSLLLTMERGFSMAISFVEVNGSRCLISSHDFPELLPQPCVRTSTQEPFNFLPWSVNFKSPFVSAAFTSADSGVQVPSSHTMTVPPPYSPSGMTPSKLAYSTG